jgi:hypothetical protein
MENKKPDREKSTQECTTATSEKTKDTIRRAEQESNNNKQYVKVCLFVLYNTCNVCLLMFVLSVASLVAYGSFYDIKTHTTHRFRDNICLNVL